jgi:molybdopterin-biosynthesis enzyme MoeA-like protein
VPSTNASAMEASIQDTKGTSTDACGLWNYGNQNTIVENLLEQRTLKATIMDAYDLLLTRPDEHIEYAKGHQDCLHYCLPGPPDELTQVLLHELKRSWETTNNNIIAAHENENWTT